MAEFVNLNDDNDSLNIVPTTPTSLANVTPETTVIGNESEVISIDIPTKQVEYLIDEVEVESESQSCPCDVEQYYGDTNIDDSFKRSNLFSELVTDYQRATARFNLGIADEYSMVWGNIDGNIVNQADLVTYIQAQYYTNANDLIAEINTKLSQWAYEIQQSLNAKANIDSPSFTGTPVAPTPSINDTSNKIATTEWVTNKISESSIGVISFMSLDKYYRYFGDPATSVTCAWEYSSLIENQWINGIPIPIGDRSYTFNNILTPFVVTLSYNIDGKTYYKSLSFESYYPIYYGISNTYTNNTRTKDSNITFTCNQGEYLYLFIPNKDNARIAVDNIIGGFSKVGTLDLYGIRYYVYKTVNSGLGELFINIL